MCKFHEDVARDIATVGGTLILSHYAIARLGLAKYWLSRYMPDGGDISGFSIAEMTRPKTRESYDRSNLARPLEDVKKDRADGVALLKSRLRDLEKSQDISSSALRLPRLAPALEAFLDDALVNLYEGDPKADYELRTTATRPEFQPLLDVTRALIADPETKDTFRRLLEGSIVMLFEDARIKSQDAQTGGLLKKHGPASETSPAT